jgi:DNA-binding transcriptional LysR family regulator
MDRIGIRHLQAAIAVAEERSFTKAAAKLRITQPNLTKQVQELEDYLGVKLFVRSNQGVILTEPCKTFIEESKVSLFHLDRAIHTTRAVSQGAAAILNFGSSPFMDPYLVSLVLSVRLPKYPKLSVRASSAFSEELCHQVLTAQLDIALVASVLPDSRLNFLHIASHPFYAVFQNQDELARNKTISLNDYHDRVWILFGRQVHPTLYDQVRARANELGVIPREIHHVTSAEQATYLIHHHGAVAFLTQIGGWRIARDGLTMRPLADDQLVLKTALVTRTDDRSRLTSEFLRAAMRKLQEKSGAHRERLSLAG